MKEKVDYKLTNVHFKQTSCCTGSVTIASLANQNNSAFSMARKHQRGHKVLRDLCWKKSNNSNLCKKISLGKKKKDVKKKKKEGAIVLTQINITCNIAFIGQSSKCCQF